jgi:hypothetical protein
MSIPLDRLYHYIENIAKEINEDVVIYRFWPHGSKNLENLEELVGTLSWVEKTLKLNITCHDQEVLSYGLQTNNFTKILESLSLLDYKIHNLIKTPTANDIICLLHSEKRSDHVLKYQNHQCVPVYYWSHALISLDWFRFAQHVQQKKNIKKLFLIYNRAWSGTREYRLRFSELLIKLDLHLHCRTTVNPIEPELGIHYELHRFKNPVWRPSTVLENFFPVSNARSHYSADFDIKDYEATDIEVVLETLFDDSRLHLTEKSLRPIACGQPFILAGTYGSLEYLRSYGFKTFGDIWDERYDQVEDPEERLMRIADLLKQISNWMPAVRERKMAQARAIADYNKKHFFSEKFFKHVTEELKINLTAGINEIASVTNFQPFIDRWKHRLSIKEVRDYLENPEPDRHPGFPALDQVNFVLDTLKN